MRRRRVDALALLPSQLMGRSRRSDEEGTTPMAWIRRRRERKAARRAARMLLTLEEVASLRPKPRRVANASLGGTR